MLHAVLAIRTESPFKGEDGIMLIGFGVCLCFNLHMGNAETARRFLNGAIGLCSFLFSAACTDNPCLDCKGACGIRYLI